MDPVLDVQVGLAGWSRLSRLIRYREESGDICRQLGWYREQPRPYGGGALFYFPAAIEVMPGFPTDDGGASMDLEALKQELATLHAKALQELDDVQDTKRLGEWRVAYLGKKSELTTLSKQMGQLDAQTRPLFGQLLNERRQALEGAFTSKRESIEAAEQNARLAAETIDITLPGRHRDVGAVHQFPG